MVVTSAVALPQKDVMYGNISEEGKGTIMMSSSGLNTETVVRAYFKDIPVLTEIARCESTFRHTLADGSVLRGNVDSADVGVMQINTRYHADRAEALGLDLLDFYDNMAYARDLYMEQGTRPWRASAACWEHTIAMR